jgi:putative transposase
MQEHRGWYSRGYLPHYDEPGLIQAITFRLHDSLPMERRDEWSPLATTDASKRRARLQALLDAGWGSCALRDERIARVVEQAFLFYDGKTYRLLAWVVMPNHVHVLIEVMPGHSLASIVRKWKTYTAKQANKILGSQGPFWQSDYYDRYIRNEQHLEQAVLYVHGNPVKAGLVQRAEDWPFSSARWVVAGEDTRAPIDATFHPPWEE